MRKLISFLVIIVVVVGVVGFARGWFSFASEKGGSGGTNVELHIDDQKVKTDVNKLGEGLKSLEKKADSALHSDNKK
jgi:preprotein translocase subunit SecF